MIKLICSDIDGTLLDKDRELSERTIAVSKKLKDDYPIILISSRMPAAMRHLQSEIDILHYPLIAYNGGLVVDYSESTKKILLSKSIQVGIAVDILVFTKETEIHTSLYHGDEWHVPSMDYWAQREQSNTKVSPTVSDIKQICHRWQSEEKGAHKIMCMGPAEEIKSLYEYLLEKYNDTLHVYRSKDTYLEIASKEISKLSALSFLLNRMYPVIELEDVIAFGDNYNDVEMISGVGHGVAVANAKPEVKAVANEITLGNKEDGVAITLEKLFDL